LFSPIEKYFPLHFTEGKVGQDAYLEVESYPDESISELLDLDFWFLINEVWHKLGEKGDDFDERDSRFFLK